MLLLGTTVFGLAWWLGCYLLARNAGNLAARFAGLGLLAYGLAVALDLLNGMADSTFLARLGWGMLFLPAFFWFGAIMSSLPEPTQTRLHFRPWLETLLWAEITLTLVLSSGTNLIIQIKDGVIQAGVLFWVYAGILIFMLLAALILALNSSQNSRKFPQARKVIIVATLFFVLAAGILLLPQTWLPRRWLILAIGGDLLTLAIAIAWLNAFDDGEILWPDMIRSFTLSLAAALVFGIQVVIVMQLQTSITLWMSALLLLTAATAITLPFLAAPLQHTLDRLIFAHSPRIQQEIATQQALAANVSRRDDQLDLLALEEAEFARLTRRALSHLANLPKLAASPLTHLPQIEKRLQTRGDADNTLARATELRKVLNAGIHKLKPAGEAEFGATDEWRFYNALYFPYIAGIKPYSRRPANSHLEGAEKAAYNWFQQQVPERTLYNWQKSASALIAKDLREIA